MLSVIGAMKWFVSKLKPKWKWRDVATAGLNSGGTISSASMHPSGLFYATKADPNEYAIIPRGISGLILDFQGVQVRPPENVKRTPEIYNGEILPNGRYDAVITLSDTGFVYIELLEMRRAELPG